MSDFYIKTRYRGKLKQPNTVYELIKETEDICRTNNWQYRIWEEDWSAPESLSMNASAEGISFEGHAPLKGITLTVGKSETIWLTFLPSGLLQSLLTIANPTFFLDDATFPWQRAKTGYDGAITHIALCKFLHYLADKYFDVFEVLDESGYWEHKDDAKFTEWINTAIRNHQLFAEGLDAIYNDESLSKEERHSQLRQLGKKFGTKQYKSGK